MVWGRGLCTAGYKGKGGMKAGIGRGVGWGGARSRVGLGLAQEPVGAEPP